VSAHSPGGGGGELVETGQSQKSSGAFLSARLFCLVHRQALESAYVTYQLPNWLDLIFGVKQSGELARRAMNVYHPAVRFSKNKIFVLI
jgi:hypothetical protein